METLLIFPHQLFSRLPHPQTLKRVILIEDHAFFYRHKFHKQKLVLHKASCAAYVDLLKDRGYTVTHILAQDCSSPSSLAKHLDKQNISKLHVHEVMDHELAERLQAYCKKTSTDLITHATPMLLTPKEEREAYFASKNHYLMHDFYVQQRKRMGILVNSDGSPKGGQWSFDEENRKKLPKQYKEPSHYEPQADKFVEQAIKWVEKTFPNNPGSLKEGFRYAITHDQARYAFDKFLEERFEHFGPYQDAISSQYHWLNHSLLTPALNIGLITPEEVVEKTLAHAKAHSIPMNSLEGFIRQVIGWREFVYGVYEAKGEWEKSQNVLDHQRSLPQSFYTATTGIDPVDYVIKHVQATGYAHHIERLMVLGNFMLLCEIKPQEVYTWFMELFIDAYDWVMVANVFGMTQFADGGLFATKPYISGSNYIRKMSDWKKGEWCDVWDALYWNFIRNNKHLLKSNARMGFMVSRAEEFAPAKKAQITKTANTFLENL